MCNYLIIIGFYIIYAPDRYEIQSDSTICLLLSLNNAMAIKMTRITDRYIQKYDYKIQL